jgi:hypothetical protein
VAYDEQGNLAAFQAFQLIPSGSTRVTVVDRDGARDVMMTRPVTLWVETVGVGERTQEEAQMTMSTLLDDAEGMVELKESDMVELVELGWARACTNHGGPPHFHLNQGHTLDDVAKKFDLEMTMDAIVRRFKAVFAKHAEAVKAGEVPPEMLEVLQLFEKRQTVTTPDQDLLSALGLAAVTQGGDLGVIKALPAIAGLVNLVMIEVARLKRRVAELERKEEMRSDGDDD